jgi:hypothetical protein
MDFDRLLQINNEYKILICMPCQYAIVPLQLTTHLRSHHSRLTTEQRRNYITEVNSCSTLARVHEAVVYPISTDPPVPSLPVYFDGLRCDALDHQNIACGYVCRNLRRMQKHCRDEHKWVNEQKQGGDTRSKSLHSPNKIWTANCACQRFFKVNDWQKYFEVAKQDGMLNLGLQASQKQDFFCAIENDIQQAQQDAADDANRVHGFYDHVSAVVPWLRETGIAKHIQSLRKDEIRTGIATPPLGDKSNLRTIIDAMRSLLQDAHRLCFDGPDCMLTYQCRVVLSRFQSSQVDLQGKTRPFDPYKGPKSLETYFGTAYRFVSYFSRVAAPNEYHFSIDTEDGDNMQRPEDIIEATDEQLAVWQDIQQIVQRTRASPTEEDEHVGDEEDRQKLKDRLLKLWMLLICHTTGARRYKSPLLSFCAMLSIKPSTKS